MIEVSPSGNEWFCRGDWTVAGTRQLPVNLSRLIKGTADSIIIDATKISKLDTVGAFRLWQIFQTLKDNGKKITFRGMPKEHQTVFELVKEKQTEIPETIKPVKQTVLEKAGRWSVEKYTNSYLYFVFIGQVVIYFWKMRAHGVKNLWMSGLKVIQTAGCEALPIVGMMSFLVGIVIAYQLGVQLKVYGADIYVVDASGIAILREFAPLMTSVIIAGRTSTAFAAFIGTMKVNDELDALSTMGIPPIERLVLPRIAGMVVALPLLVIWSSIFSILGSMMMTKIQMNIGYIAYLHRFSEQVALKQYVLGMIKTPVLAFIIASVGCFQGFQAGFTADSVGIKTTAAAVQAIFLIIIADALFSILYSWQGL